MRRADIRPAAEPVPLTGETDRTPWGRAEAIEIACFPWYESGERQATTARLLYDEKALYVQYRCKDRHISCEHAELNSSVCRDSCVELFASIEPERAPDYFNLETNACGTMLMGFGPGREGRNRIRQETASRIRIVTSVPGPTKEESPDDDGWWLAASVPFEALAEFTGRPVRPRAGTVWRGNLYRCGGKTDDQYACWNPIDAPAPDFHRPESFGELRFAAS